MFNLSRGLAVSFAIAGCLIAITGNYEAAGWSVLAFGLILFRAWKFKKTYVREIVQQFSMLDL